MRVIEITDSSRIESIFYDKKYEVVIFKEVIKNKLYDHFYSGILDESNNLKMLKNDKGEVAQSTNIVNVKNFIEEIINA